MIFFVFLCFVLACVGRIISRRTKLQIFNSNVKSVLLYGCETWKVTEQISHRLQVFVNRCLRRNINLWWPDVMSNEELWHKTSQEPIAVEIKRRKWRWIGHTLVLYCIVFYLFKKSIYGNTASRYRTSRVSSIYYITTYTNCIHVPSIPYKTIKNKLQYNNQYTNFQLRK
jgi:hypothetical protein